MHKRWSLGPSVDLVDLVFAWFCVLMALVILFAIVGSFTSTGPHHETITLPGYVLLAIAGAWCVPMAVACLVAGAKWCVEHHPRRVLVPVTEDLRKRAKKEERK